jgi:hypothetical protein
LASKTPRGWNPRENVMIHLITFLKTVLLFIWWKN